jgi:hypothetical protein
MWGGVLFLFSTSISHNKKKLDQIDTLFVKAGLRIVDKKR